MIDAHRIKRGMFVLCFSGFFAAMGVGIMAPILPIYAKDLGASGTVTGLMYACFYFSMVICNPVMGRLSDRLGRKEMITGGFGIAILIGLLYVFARNPFHLIMIRLLHGLCGAMIIPIIMAFIGDLSPVGKEGTYMGTYNMMSFLGMAFGPLAGGRIADVWGVTTSFLTYTGFTCLAFVLCLAFLPVDHQEIPDRISQQPNSGSMLASKTIIGLLIFNFTLAIAQGALMVFLPLLARGQNLTITQIGILASVFVFVAGVLQVPFGWLANRYNRVKLVMTGTLLIAIGLAYLPLASGFISLLIFGAIIGIASAIASPAAISMVVQHSRNIGMGLVMGSMNTSSSLGMIIGPIAGGVAMDILGIKYSFYLCSLIFVVGAGLFHKFTKEQ